MANPVQVFSGNDAPIQPNDGTIWIDPSTGDPLIYSGGQGGAFRRLLLSAGAALGIGYRAGAGGTVTQLTDKSTGVTLNRPSGQITMNNASLAAGAEVTFVVTNSVVAATDTVIVNHGSAGTAGSYLVGVAAVGAGSFTIVVSNASAGSLSEAIVLNYCVIKGASA